MVKVSVMYPNGDGKTFDMEYYANQHMEIVNRDMGPSRYELDKSIDGPYLAVGHFYFDSMESMRAGMGNSREAMADLPNFTNCEPVVQTSEVVG